MSAATVAVQLDAAELEELQRTARLLLAHPLVTDVHPRPGALAQVRRWRVVLGNEMHRVLGYRLDVGPRCARLYRRSATVSPHRGARTATGRALGRWGYTFLCLVLAALERLGGQTTVSELAEEVARLRAGDERLPVDLTRYDQRRAFVDAVAWLETRGVLTLRDGAAERWLAAAEEGGDALYDVDADTASRLLVSSPSVLREVEAVADFLADRYASGEDAQRQRVRHRLARRLVEGPVVLYEALPADELDYVRQRRTRLMADVERLTGCPVEARAEGLALIDANVEPLADPFPTRGTVAHAALLLIEPLVRAATREEVGPRVPFDHERFDVEASVWRPVTAEELRTAWTGIFATHRARFSAEHRADPEGLLAAAVSLLERLGLARRTGAEDGGALLAGPALARYRPRVSVSGADGQLTLLDGP
ncbi:MAG: TIGR02678 family protein [Actinobacteria bacterium]|nr:TIGR02678 family protein [Actinomycetota bacterium]